MERDNGEMIGDIMHVCDTPHFFSFRLTFQLFQSMKYILKVKQVVRSGEM